MRLYTLATLLLLTLACNPGADPAPGKPASPQACYDECQKHMMTADVTEEQADAYCRERCGLPSKPAQPAPAPDNDSPR